MGAAWKSVEGECSSKTNDKVWMELRRVRMDVAWKSKGGWSSEKKRQGANGARKSNEVWMELKRATRLGAAQRSDKVGCSSKERRGQV